MSSASDYTPRITEAMRPVYALCVEIYGMTPQQAESVAHKCHGTKNEDVIKVTGRTLHSIDDCVKIAKARVGAKTLVELAFQLGQKLG